MGERTSGYPLYTGRNAIRYNTSLGSLVWSYVWCWGRSAATPRRGRFGSLAGARLAVESTAFGRTVAGAVVSDEVACLGGREDCDDGRLRVTVSSRLPAETAVEIRIAVGDETATIADLPVAESPRAGSETAATGDAVPISATGSEVAVDLTRPLSTAR